MNPIFKLFVKVHIALFRATNGKMFSTMKGVPMLLLTTIGNKSGKPRTVPVMQFDDNGKRYIIGSMGGAPQDPAWIKNLKKTPEVDIQIKGEKYKARASLLDGAERNRIYELAKSRMDNFAAYEKKAGEQRLIPVVELTRV
jgi:deazaflavin-dependent oxidoreductase (nitroreductase family)